MILNPVSRKPWHYVETANDGKDTGGRRDERVAIDI